MRDSETIPIDESTAREVPRLRPAPAHIEEPSASANIRAVRQRPLGGLGLKTWIILVISLAALVPTAGDFGLTWDEPAYRHSQLLAVQWWEQLSEVRSWREAADVFDPITLLYFWPLRPLWHQFSSPAGGPY